MNLLYRRRTVLFIMLYIGCFLFFMLTSHLTDFAIAQEKGAIELEPVVVTASKVEEPISQVSGSVELITRHEIEERQTITLDDALRPVTGLSIRTYGGADPVSSVSLRGADDNQSIIMIDGIKVNSPYGQSPFAGALLLNSTERVEVVKGSYSVLYGSEAIGGAVNLITRKKPGLAYALAGGTHRTSHGNFLYSETYNDTFYTIGYEGLSSSGFKFSGPYWNNTLLGRISSPLNEKSAVQISSYYWDWEKYDRTVCCEINGVGDIAFIIDDDSRFREKNWLNSIQLLHAPLPWWDYSARLAVYTTDFKIDNLLEPATSERPFPLEIDSDIQSGRDTLEMQHNFHMGHYETMVTGLQYTREDVDKKDFGNIGSLGMGPSFRQPRIKEDRITTALYFQYLFKIREAGSFTAGFRFEDSPGTYSEIIPRVSALYITPEISTRLKASYGEGIRAPSFNELYHPVQGNPDLKPEESSSIEAGIEQPFINDRIGLEVTGFTIRLKDLIEVGIGPGGPGSPIYLNTGRSRIKGVEAAIRAEVTEDLDSRIGYTRLQTVNLDTDEELSFRPHYKWTVDVIYRPVNSLTLDLYAEFVGDAFNSHDFLVGLDGKALSDRIDSYKIVNIAAAYNQTKRDSSSGNLDFTMKLNNLFDEEYSVLPGFQNDGFNFIIGIRSTH